MAATAYKVRAYARLVSMCWKAIQQCVYVGIWMGEQYLHAHLSIG